MSRPVAFGRAFLRRFAALALGAVPLALAAPSAADEAARAALVEEVRRVELEFAATVRDKQPSKFAAMLDEQAVFVSGGDASRGRDQIVADWAPFFAPDAPAFEWHPEIVELSGDGTLGLSRGPWTIRGRGPDGRELVREGLYNSVWRRQPDGGWKIVFDAGCGGCPSCG